MGHECSMPFVVLLAQDRCNIVFMDYSLIVMVFEILSLCLMNSEFVYFVPGLPSY